MPSIMAPRIGAHNDFEFEPLSDAEHAQTGTVDRACEVEMGKARNSSLTHFTFPLYCCLRLGNSIGSHASRADDLAPLFRFGLDENLRVVGRKHLGDHSK